MATKAQPTAQPEVANASPSADIPSPPGGGSWRWDGSAWQSNTAPAAAPKDEPKGGIGETAEQAPAG